MAESEIRNIQHFTIMDDGIGLDAVLEMPKERGEKYPVLIIIHGFTGWKEETHLSAMAKAAKECGYAALRVDMYGHGGSGGRFRDHTLYKWLTNIITVIDYARKMEGAGDIFLMGHSQGGLAVVLAAAMERDVVKGLIPLAPALMIPEGARKGRLLGTDFDPEDIPETVVPGDYPELGGNYLRVAQTLSVEDAIDRYKGPVLIVHGDTDMTVPFSCSAEAAPRYENCELVNIHGDTHCFDLHLNEAVAAVRSFLEKHKS